MKFTYHDTDRVTLEMTFDQFMWLRSMAFEAKMEAATKASYAKHMKSPREILTERRRHAKEYAAVAAALEAASKNGSWPNKAKSAKAKPASAGYKKRAATKPARGTKP